MIPKAPKDRGIDSDDKTNLSKIKVKIWEHHLRHIESEPNEPIGNDVEPEDINFMMMSNKN